MMKKMIQYISAAVFVAFTIIRWASNHLKWHVSFYQRFAIQIMIILSLIVLIWLSDMKNIYKYLFSVLLILSTFILAA